LKSVCIIIWSTTNATPEVILTQNSTVGLEMLLEQFVILADWLPGMQINSNWYCSYTTCPLSSLHSVDANTCQLANQNGSLTHLLIKEQQKITRIPKYPSLYLYCKRSAYLQLYTRSLYQRKSVPTESAEEIKHWTRDQHRQPHTNAVRFRRPPADCLFH
jgi:hypothetical protein